MNSHKSIMGMIATEAHEAYCETYDAKNMGINKHKWVSEGINPRLSDNGWQIHRRNRTSGKSRGGIVAGGMGEYAAKTMCNDANRGAGCFAYKVISPIGEIFSLQPPLPRLRAVSA